MISNHRGESDAVHTHDYNVDEHRVDRNYREGEVSK